jgi:hypothetical protein
MTVEILRLSVLPGKEAEQAANTLLDLRSGPPDLRRLLVLDDTALLVEHASVFERLVTARRVEDLLCVAVGPRPVGPRPGDTRMLRLPGNLGGTQGSGVLWVGDPDGIDWRVGAAAVALGHPAGSVSGLDRLVELLRVEEIFDRVHNIFTTTMPGRVASPGLRLAGADDEAATFAAALAVAIRRLTDPGPGTEGPFAALLPAQADGATLADGGSLARYRDEVDESVGAAAEALAKLGGLSGRFRRGEAEVREHVIEAGAALADLRDMVVRLFQDANSMGELTENQRRLVLAAGIRLRPPAAPAPPGAATGPAATQSPAYRAIAEAIRGGDGLPLVIRRLTMTERELKRRGSASYLAEVGQRCPPSLLSRLENPGTSRPATRRAAAEARHELGLDAAIRAAAGLLELVAVVASREWSPAVMAPGELARVRIALDGVRKTLTDYAQAAGGVASGARGARLSRLGESLTPVLCDLVLRVLAAESTSPSASGHEAFETAQDKAAALLADWTRQVQADGVSARPPFAVSGVHEVTLYSGDDDVPEVKEALLYRPGQEMWQLCAPEDLSALDVAAPPQAVWFAPRLNKDVLVGTVPADAVVWTSSGAQAGLLRLVPLRPGLVSSVWAEVSAPDQPASTAGPRVTEPS